MYDYGGDGPIIHLAPANGFPPGAYRLLAETLVDRYHVVALLPRPLWPGSHPREALTWRLLAQDLVRGLDESGQRGVVGLGHSLGGVLTLWAAIERPDLFRAVILADPVILPPSWLWALRLMRTLGLQDRQPLVQGALRRRRTWPSRQACFDYYRNKPLFTRWSDAALWDYVRSGTREIASGQVELVYPPEWEAHIFATAPLNIWRDVPRLRPPVLVMRGEYSDAFRPAAQARLARLLPRSHLLTIPDTGHLFPMERPAQSAAAIHGFLDEI